VRARIWGCRGSLATPGESTVGYGGNTTCVEIRAEGGRVVVLDAGTGIRALGVNLANEGVRELDLLLTHLHLDHIEGLGFLAPFFDPACTIRIHGPRPASASLADTLRTYLSPPFFPVPFERFDADVSFVEIERDAWQIDGLAVSSAPVQHPGPTLAYRLSEHGRSVAFVPDNEPALRRDSGLELAGGADLLLHDAQYTDEEYETRVGWGHTSLGQFAQFVQRAAAKRVVMFHHDPAHADATLEAMRETVSELAGAPVELAAEGLRL